MDKAAITIARNTSCVGVAVGEGGLKTPCYIIRVLCRAVFWRGNDEILYRGFDSEIWTLHRNQSDIRKATPVFICLSSLSHKHYNCNYLVKCCQIGKR